MKRIFKVLSACTFVFLFSVLLSVCAFATDVNESMALKAKNTETGTGLIWNALENASRYNIYRQAKGEKTEALIAEVTATVYKDDSVVPGMLYSYRVVPVFEDGSSPDNCKNVLICHLSAPKITTKRNVYEGIGFIWSKSEGASAYYVYRRKPDASGWICIAKTDKNTTSHIDKTVTPDQTYCYAVRAANSGYLSYQSNFLETDFLAAPQINKILCLDGQIGFRWTKSAKSVSYIIYRATSKNKTYTQYAVVDSSKNIFFDENVTSGVLYGYIVRAVDGSNNLSGYAPASIIRYLAKPEIIKMENVADGISITWSKSAGAQKYAVYRRNANSSEWKLLGTRKGEANVNGIDKTAVNGVSYVYAVRAVYDKTLSDYEESIVARHLTPPKNLKVTSKGSSGNSLSWSANKYATKYYIYRKASGEKWQLIAKTNKNALVDATAQAGKLYLYAVRSYVSSSCYSAACTPVLSSGINPNGKMVALTYDDGPSNTVTNYILDTLEKYGGKATFFVVGQRINGNYQPMQRAVKMGCEIGNHTYSHIDLPSSYSYEITEEITATDNLVKKYTGVTPKLARAPGGSTDSYSASLVGKPFIYWSVDTRDWESRYAPSVIENVKYYTQDGSIILMHDIYDSTAEASEEIIPWLVNQGYQLVTVSEMMYYRGVTLRNGVTYYNAYR